MELPRSKVVTAPLPLLRLLAGECDNTAAPSRSSISLRFNVVGYRFFRGVGSTAEHPLQMPIIKEKRRIAGENTTLLLTTVAASFSRRLLGYLLAWKPQSQRLPGHHGPTFAHDSVGPIHAWNQSQDQRRVTGQDPPGAYSRIEAQNEQQTRPFSGKQGWLACLS